MTREELCIHACKYAIGELTRKGSSAFITSAHEGRQQITWVEVMEWLNRGQQSEDTISGYSVLHKIAEFFINWDGDENAKLEISVSDMREISNMFTTKCRAESKLKALQKPCEDTISRQAALDIYDDYNVAVENGELEAYRKHRERLLKLSSIQPKTGHWINKSLPSGCGIRFVASECTCCGRITFFDCDQLVYNYCPHCGAKMVEPQESEE